MSWNVRNKISHPIKIPNFDIAKARELINLDLKRLLSMAEIEPFLQNVATYAMISA